MINTVNDTKFCLVHVLQGLEPIHQFSFVINFLEFISGGELLFSKVKM
jgi:hypothetical protein